MAKVACQASALGLAGVLQVVPVNADDNAGASAGVHPTASHIMHCAHRHSPVKPHFFMGVGGRLKRSARAVRAQCNYLGIWPW